MKCTEHPHNDSIGKCANCDKEICRLCLTALADKAYCPLCLDKLIGPNTEETLVDLSKAIEKTIVGIRLFWVGIVAIIISVIISLIVDFFSYVLLIALFGAIAGFLFVVIGAILFSVGKSECKKAKNQKSPSLRTDDG